MIGALASRIEEMFSQHKVGLIDDDLWDRYRGTFASFLDNQIVKEWWDPQVAPYSSDFRLAIDNTPQEIKDWKSDTLHVLTGTTPDGGPVDA